MPNTTSCLEALAPEVKYGGFTRFEIELEFVQSLGNPQYASHLATLSTPSVLPSTINSVTVSQQFKQSQTTTVPLLQHPSFIAYLAYLQYFKDPKYLGYLTYPGPTLKMLELLQSERFRREIMSPDLVEYLIREGVKGMEKWNAGDA